VIRVATSTGTPTCTLCDLPIHGEPVADDEVDGSFCCPGCLEVYRTMGDVPLDDLDSGAGTDPADDVLPPDDAETAYLSVSGMHCATCETFLERTATRQTGVHAAEASYATELVKLVYDPDALAEADLPGVVSHLGYRASLPDDDTEREQEDRFTLAGIRTVVGLLAAMAVMTLYAFFLYPTYLGVYPTSFLYEQATTIMVFTPIPLLATFVLFVVGFPILRGAYVSLRAGEPNMDLLVAFGATAAYVYSLATLLAGGRVVYFDVAVVIVSVVTAGNYLEWKIRRGAVASLSDLRSRRVTEARRRIPALDGGVEADGEGTTGATAETVPVEALQPGDAVVVGPGEPIPVDGTVVDGHADVDEALVSGEAAPRWKAPGDDVVGGAVVLDETLVVEVGEDATSTVERIVTQLWDIEAGGGRTARVADRLAAVFVPAVLLLAAGVALAHVLLGGAGTAAVLVGVSVLVVSCPCSFGLAPPMALATAVSRAAAEGVVVTNAAAFEDAADAALVALDKTGTLTTGEMRVVDVVAEGVDEASLLGRAAAVEVGVTHPVAAAIVRAADAPATTAAPPADVESLPRGASATVEDVETLVGHPAVFAERGWTIPPGVEETVAEMQAEGAIATLVGWDGRARGAIAVRDEPREGWEAVVAGLAADGRAVVVLTGDDQSSVDRFADHPDVEQVYTGMLPEAKAAAVKRLRADRGPVAMVGDGINDAPALAASDLGIAFGEESALATDAADVTVVEGDLDVLEGLLARAQTTRRRVRQNLGWALAYNAVAIPLAVLGLINPLVAAVAMATSSLLVVANSARGGV